MLIYGAQKCGGVEGLYKVLGMDAASALALSWILLFPVTGHVVLFPVAGGVGVFVNGSIITTYGSVFNVSFAPVCRLWSNGSWWLVYTVNGTVYVRSPSGWERLVGSGPPLCGSDGVYAGGRAFVCGGLHSLPAGLPVCVNGTPAVIDPSRLMIYLNGGWKRLYPVHGRLLAATGWPRLAGVVESGAGFVYVVWEKDGSVRYARYVPVRPEGAACVAGACAVEAAGAVYILYNNRMWVYDGRLAAWSLLDGRPVFLVIDGGTGLLVSPGGSVVRFNLPCSSPAAADFLGGYVAASCPSGVYIATIAKPPRVSIHAPARVVAGEKLVVNVTGSFQYAVVRFNGEAHVLLSPGAVSFNATSPGVFRVTVEACNGLLCVKRYTPVAVEAREARVLIHAPRTAEPYSVINVSVEYVSGGHAVNGTCVVKYPRGFLVTRANTNVSVPFDPVTPEAVITATCSAPGYESATNGTTVKAAKPFLTVKTLYLGAGRLNLTVYNNYTRAVARDYGMVVKLRNDTLLFGYTGIVNLTRGPNIINVTITYNGTPVERLVLNATYHGTVFNVSGPFCVHLADVPVVKTVTKTVVKTVPRPVPVTRVVERLPAALAAAIGVTSLGAGAAACYAWLRRRG